MPSAEYQQGYEPPYGQQYQRDDGSMGQTYGPQVVDQAGTVSQPYFEYPKCKCCHVLISPGRLHQLCAECEALHLRQVFDPSWR
jgi:hypothetical protein